MYPVYHKIQTVFERDPATKHKTLLEGKYSRPEFSYLKNCIWTFTEKVDGTNIRVMFDGQGFEYYGKSDTSQIPALLGNRLREMFEPLREGFSKAFPQGCCFYGEGYGEKIQKVGGLYRKGQSFVLLDVKVGTWWLERWAVESIAKDYGLEVVPVLGEGTLVDMVDVVREGFKSRWGDFIAEGIVARPRVELFARNGERIITKIKHKDFRK